MSTSTKQSNVPHFQNADGKGQKHKKQENVNKSRIASKSFTKKSRSSESWMVRSFLNDDDDGISQDDFQEPSFYGKQTNLFCKSLQEKSWYQPPSLGEDWIDPQDVDEEREVKEEADVNTLGLSGTPPLKLRSGGAGAHGNDWPSFMEFTPSQKKRGIPARKQELLEDKSHLGKPKFSSTRVSQGSRTGRRKNVKFEMRKYTSDRNDGVDRKHHQGRVPEMPGMSEEEAESGESWYDQSLVDLPMSLRWTGRSFHQADVEKFDEYPAMKTSFRKDEKVSSKKFSAEKPDIDSNQGLTDPSNLPKSLLHSSEMLKDRAGEKGSSTVRHQVSSRRMRMKGHSTLETDNHGGTSIGGEGYMGHSVEDMSVYELEDDTNFLEERCNVWLHSPSNSESPLSALSTNGGFHRPHDDEYRAPFLFSGRENTREVDHLKGKSDLMSSLQHVDSVQDLLMLQYQEGLNDFHIPFSVKEFLYEKDSKPEKPETFLKEGLDPFGGHDGHPASSHFESTSGTLCLDIGLHGTKFHKAQPLPDENFERVPLPVQEPFPSSEYSFLKENTDEEMGSMHMQDFFTSQKDSFSQVSSPENRAMSSWGKEGTVERMVSGVILSQNEVMSQLLDSSFNLSRSSNQTRRTEGSSVSWDAETISVPVSTVNTGRQAWVDAEEKLESLDINSTANRDMSTYDRHRQNRRDDITIQKGRNDIVLLSSPDLSTANQSEEGGEDWHQLRTFSTNLDRGREYSDEKTAPSSFSSVDSLLLSSNPQMSSMNRTTDITANYSMQESSVFLGQHTQRKSVTSKHKLQPNKTVLNEKSEKLCESDTTSLYLRPEINVLPKSRLHSGKSHEESSDKKSAKKSLMFELPPEIVRTIKTPDHYDCQDSLKDEIVAHSSLSGYAQQTNFSANSLKYNPTSSKFHRKIYNESFNNSNGDEHRHEATFQKSEEANTDVTSLGEVTNRDQDIIGKRVRLPNHLSTSKEASGKVSSFANSSFTSDFTQSLHLSELGGAGELDARDEDVDYDAADVRREDGEKGIHDKDSGSLAVRRPKIESQTALQKMAHYQRGQYDKGTVLDDEIERRNRINVKRTFHEEAVSLRDNTLAWTGKNNSNNAVQQVGFGLEGQYGSRTLLHDQPGGLWDKPVRNAYSLPPVADSNCYVGISTDVSKQPTESFKKSSSKGDLKQEKLTKKEQSGNAVISSLHSKGNTPQKSLLQDVTLLSGLGWTVRVRNILRETPKKKHGEIVSKAYWLKRWRISTRVQKMLRAEEEGQMQSAILFHEVFLLHKYLTAWKTITRKKQDQASEFYQRYLLRKGMRALQSSVRERETNVKYLEERVQHSLLRSAFLKWQSVARLYQDHELVAVRYSDRKRLVFAFHKWREKLRLKQKERIANLHYKLHLLSSHFVKWKIYVSDQKVHQEQSELARVFLEGSTLRESWETWKAVYQKKVVAQQQDRRCLLAKVLRSWRHGTKLSRLETIEDHHKAQEFRKASLMRTHIALWREEVVVSQARRKLDVVSLRYAFDLWKLKLEKKNLVARIVASKLRKAAKLRALSVWRKKTHENRERRLEGTRILEKLLLRQFFQNWRMVVGERKERSSKALLWGHQTHLRRKMQLFTSWRRRTQEKQQIRALKEYRRLLLVGKFAVRWRQVVKVKQDEVKVQNFQEKRRLHLVKAAFSIWVAGFDQMVEDQQLVKEAKETLAQNKVHRTFLSWRLVAREGAVIKPLLEKRRLKMMSSIFTSWHKVARDKKLAQQMWEKKRQRTLALAYYAWRQQYLGVLQQRIVAEAHERNHLQRVFRAWHLVGKRKKIAQQFAVRCKEEMLRKSFLYWKVKTEEMEMRKERERGEKAREIVLKKTYLRCWMSRIRDQRDEEGFLCSRISEMQERHILKSALCEWKYSHHTEIQARDHQNAATNRLLKTILYRWHQHARYSFQRSLELFTHSLHIDSPEARSEAVSDISRVAAASESSFLSETQQFSVVDSGYHGNRATLTGHAWDGLHIGASSGMISGTEISDGDIMSYQSFKTSSEGNDHSVYSSPRHNGTVQSDEISYAYSSSQSFMQMEFANDLGENILLEGEHSSFRNSDSMILLITKENDNAHDDNSLSNDYTLTEEELVSSVTRNEVYQHHWSDSVQTSSNLSEVSSEPATSMKALSSSASSSETGASSTSSCHLCTVKYQPPESNALRDIWLGEAGSRSDGGSLGEMSLKELGELDGEGSEGDDMLQEDTRFQAGAFQIPKVELLTYMIHFWRLWPASAAFLQWLAYTRYRRNERMKMEKFIKWLEKKRLQKCFQLWRRRSEVAAIAQNHEETVKLRKYFDALRNYCCLQKKQREDEEVARRWRNERCLRDSFHHWKLQFLRSNAVGGLVPSWEYYSGKGRLLQLRAASFTQKVQGKNVQECFMFWKLRFWQQVQVRDYHEKILKLRHFKAWLEWLQLRKWRRIQQETFLHQRLKSQGLARWRKALHEKSKVEVMRSKVNQNHLKEIVTFWYQYSRMSREDRVRTVEIQHIVNQGSLRQYWNVWRGRLGHLMEAQKHRNEALVKRSFTCWSEWTQLNARLHSTVIQVRNISQKQILKSSFAKWHQRLETKKRLVLLLQKQKLSLVKGYFMRWKEFVDRRRQEKKRQRELMEQVITQWMSICSHGQKTRDLAHRSLHKWRQLIIRSGKLSAQGDEFIERKNNRCLESFWRRWKDESHKCKKAKEFWENSSRKCVFTRWSCLTQERKGRLAKLQLFQAEHDKNLVVQYFQTWREQFSQLQSKAEIENEFRGQRSQRLLARSFKCWFQQFCECKAARHHQISLERKVWIMWKTSQDQTQKIKQFREECQKKKLQAAFSMLHKWTIDRRTKEKLMSMCLEKKDMNSLKEAFGSWKKQTNQLQQADDIYQRHLLKRNLRAWSDFHRRKKQLKLQAADIQAMFSFNHFMQSLPGCERFLTLELVQGNSKDVCMQKLRVCFKIWKMKSSVREAERLRVKLLTQKVVDRWRKMVEMRRYERQVEDELEKLAGKYHRQKLRRAVFVAWRQEAWCQRRLRERQGYLSHKYGNLWMKITSQRIIAEQMDHYWTLKRRWVRWRRVMIQSKVSKKFMEEDEARLCLEVFEAWRKAAQEGSLSKPM